MSAEAEKCPMCGDSVQLCRCYGGEPSFPEDEAQFDSTPPAPPPPGAQFGYLESDDPPEPIDERAAFEALLEAVKGALYTLLTLHATVAAGELHTAWGKFNEAWQARASLERK